MREGEGEGQVFSLVIRVDTYKQRPEVEMAIGYWDTFFISGG